MHCINNKRCPVLPGTRNRCQYCRLLKCLRLGMSRNAVKMGRRRTSNRYSDEVKDDDVNCAEDSCKNIAQDMDRVDTSCQGMLVSFIHLIIAGTPIGTIFNLRIHFVIKQFIDYNSY